MWGGGEVTLSNKYFILPVFTVCREGPHANASGQGTVGFFMWYTSSLKFTQIWQFSHYLPNYMLMESQVKFRTRTGTFLELHSKTASSWTTEADGEIVERKHEMAPYSSSGVFKHSRNQRERERERERDPPQARTWTRGCCSEDKASVNGTPTLPTELNAAPFLHKNDRIFIFGWTYPLMLSNDVCFFSLADLLYKLYTV